MQAMNSHFLQVPLCDLTDYLCRHTIQWRLNDITAYICVVTWSKIGTQ